MYLERLALVRCYSFENRRKLFDIHRSFKFATVVARAAGPTQQFDCAFYLHDDEWLFGARNDQELAFALPFVRASGGEYLALIEPRRASDFKIIKCAVSDFPSTGSFLQKAGITPNTSELPMIGGGFFTDTSSLLNESLDPRVPEIASQLLGRQYIAMHEGKTFWHFDESWEGRPRYCVSLNRLADRPRWLSLCRYFRVVYREVSCATNERTAVFCVLAPPHVTARNAASDITPSQHPNHEALLLASVGNSYAFDYLLRFYAQTHVTLFMLTRVPFPCLDKCSQSFLAHSALRLTCNHAGYAPLWREQVGDAWREEGKPPLTWPVLAGDEERWATRAAIDAVVADAYGLSREQYAHVLSTFSHTSFRRVPELCLAAFDELQSIGLDAFIRQHDPYHDIPLNESLPQPVIELPLPAAPSSELPRGEASGGTPLLPDAAAGEASSEFRLTRAPKARRARKRK